MLPQAQLEQSRPTLTPQHWNYSIISQNPMEVIPVSAASPWDPLDPSYLKFSYIKKSQTNQPMKADDIRVPLKYPLSLKVKNPSSPKV